MNDERSFWFKIATFSGILTPIIAFACILTAIALYPPFSWTDNALSDLGVVKGAVSLIFNAGLITSGMLALIFATELQKYIKGIFGKIGAFLFAFDAVALMAIGTFPENTSLHLPASVAFFALFPLAMFFTGVALIKTGDVYMAVSSFSAAIFSLTVWGIQFAVGFGKGVAIPETLTSLAVSSWALALSFKMLKQKAKVKRQKA